MHINQVSSKSTKRTLKSLCDEELLKLIAKGNQGAMEELFDRHQTQVYRFSRRLVGDDGRAEDVTAETFCQVWRGAAAGFKGNAQVATWLLAIARNLGISVLRRRSEQELDDATAQIIEDPVDNPEVSLAKLQQSAIVARCLDRLSPKHREPIELFYFQGKSIDEVAAIVGVPHNTVKTRMFRGRVLMAQLLKNFAIERSDSMLDGKVRIAETFTHKRFSPGSMSRAVAA
jgi:RNA polymerase sigma-70 factor (ECF subfamily)